MDTKNIGELLKAAWQESNLSQKDFADQMDMSVRNLQYLFEKNDIHISQLIKASAVLKKDFIKDYLEIMKINKGIEYPSEYNSDKLVVQEVLEKYYPNKQEKRNVATVQLNIKGEISLLSQFFPEILDIVKREAEARGLTIA